MRLTKEEFCTAVDKYEKMCEEESKVLEVLDCSPEWKFGNWLNEYFDLLQTMCDLPENTLYGTDLSYYCYDLNFGKHWKPGTITVDGKDFPCRNSEELWNLIMFDEERE